MNELTEKIWGWFEEKEMHDEVMQTVKMVEEVGELAHEITRGKGRSEEAKDAVGDIYVTLVGVAHHLGLDLEECVGIAWSEIKDRKGKVINGSFVKYVKEEDE